MGKCALFAILTGHSPMINEESGALISQLAARFTALTMALREAVTMFGSTPTPQ
jgi:hypothetical protein